MLNSMQGFPQFQADCQYSDLAVFPNSEELQHWDELLNVVRCKGENILIMTTSKILGKPWCLAEIARAEQMTRPTCA